MVAATVAATTRANTESMAPRSPDPAADPTDAIRVSARSNPFAMLARVARALGRHARVRLLFQAERPEPFSLGDPHVVHALLARNGLRAHSMQPARDAAGRSGAWLVEAERGP